MASSGWQGIQATAWGEVIGINLYVSTITRTNGAAIVTGYLKAEKRSGSDPWYNYPIYAAAPGTGTLTILAANAKVSTAQNVPFTATVSCSNTATTLQFPVNISNNNGAQTTRVWNLSMDTYTDNPIFVEGSTLIDARTYNSITISVKLNGIGTGVGFPAGATTWCDGGNQTGSKQTLRIVSAVFSNTAEGTDWAGNRIEDVQFISPAATARVSGTVTNSDYGITNETCQGAGGGAFKLAGCGHYTYGLWASNGTSTTYSARHAFYLPPYTPTISSVDLASKGETTAVYTVIARGGATDNVKNASSAKVDNYYRVSTNGGSSYGAWTVINQGVSPSTSVSFLITVPYGASVKVQFQQRAHMDATQLATATYSFTSTDAPTKAYASVSGKARKVTRIYAPVSGKAKKVIKVYKGNSSNKAQLVYHT